MGLLDMFKSSKINGKGAKILLQNRVDTVENCLHIIEKDPRRYPTIESTLGKVFCNRNFPCCYVDCDGTCRSKQFNSCAAYTFKNAKIVRFSDNITVVIIGEPYRSTRVVGKHNCSATHVSINTYHAATRFVDQHSSYLT